MTEGKSTCHLQAREPESICRLHMVEREPTLTSYPLTPISLHDPHTNTYKINTCSFKF